ncbi:MAG: AMP-binding protein [Cohaesibacteraceae bacterium]
MTGDVFLAGQRYAASSLRLDAARAASGLVDLGATDNRVALFLRNDVTFLVASEAARLAGATALPVNWHLKADDVAYILEDSKTDIIIAHADLWRGVAEQLPGALRDQLTVFLVPTPDAICAAYQVDPAMADVPSGIRDWNAFVLDNFPIAEPRTTNRYPLLYTSGTTGRPKGVQRLDARRPEPVAYDAFFEPGMRTHLATPFYHSAPNRFLQGTFEMGGTLVLPVRFNAEQMLKEIEKYRITTSFMVPAMLQRFARLPDNIRAAYDLSSLRHVVIAGAPCPAELKASIIDWWGPVIYEYYGSTETSALTFASSAEALARPGTVGRAVATAHVDVLEESGAPCATGVSGEIYGRRQDIPDFTYLNKPEARAKAGAGDLVSVGDIGYLDEDGFLFLSDRKTDLIISNGVNIYPAQVEAALLVHDCVADCAVFGIPDSSAGEAVAAIVQSADGQQLDPHELAGFLETKLASFMVPKFIEQRQDFPRDAAGKIKKRDLRAPFWEGAKRAI